MYKRKRSPVEYIIPFIPLMVCLLISLIAAPSSLFYCVFILTIPIIFLGLIILIIYYHVKSKDTKLSEDERKSYKIDRNISLGCTIHSAGGIYKNTKECIRDIQRDSCKK